MTAAAPEVEASFLACPVTLAAEEDSSGRRMVEGIAVPYGEPLSRPHRSGARFQVFEKGAARFRPNAQLFYGHDHLTGGLPVGRVLSEEVQHLDEGAAISAALSVTPKGEEVYVLLKDGVLDRFSIGFYDVAGYLSEDGDTWHHTEVEVFETSVVPDPAYQTAAIKSVLHQQHPTKEGNPTMTAAAPTAEDFETLSTSVTDLSRQVATLGALGGDDADAISVPYGSYGAFILGAARREDEALAFLAAIEERVAQYQLGTVADLGGWVKDSWVGEITQRPRARKLHALFESGALPASGLSVEYGFLDHATTDADVAKQTAEGETLAYGKIAFDVATAPVETFGGWGDMSVQKIQRSGVAVVEKFFAYLAGMYDKTTEANLRAKVLDLANATALAGTGVDDLTTVAGVTDFVIDASFALEDNANGILVPEFVLVGRGMFKAWANLTMTAGERPFLDRDSGKIDVVGLAGEVFSLPVVPVAGAADDFVRVGHSSAIKTFEDGAAPFRLQDGDITNLTEAFSVYGYEAVAVQDKTALIAPDVTA